MPLSMEVRGKVEGVISLLPPCGSWSSNLGLALALLPTGPPSPSFL